MQYRRILAIALCLGLVTVTASVSAGRRVIEPVKIFDEYDSVSYTHLDVYKRQGHVFRDPALLERALTHRSAAAVHNERLEFLGDALVGAIVAEALYARWPRAAEGELTRARAELVRESALAALARRLDLGPRILLGPGEMKSGGHRRESILSDALEACLLYTSRCV